MLWIYLLLSGSIGIVVGIMIGIYIEKIFSRNTILKFPQELFRQIDELKIRSEERDNKLSELVRALQRWMEMVMKQGSEVDRELSRRIENIVDQFKNFLSAEKTYREELEKKRDQQILEIKEMVTSFIEMVSGTKTRGIVGEKLLEGVLRPLISAGIVEKNLPIGSLEVEFAWKLDERKYIPIDSKFPEVFKNGERNQTEIKQKIRKEIERVKKYQNQPNTVREVILVVPESILEMSPELFQEAFKEGVILTTYKTVIPVAFLIQDKYLTYKNMGNTSLLQKAVQTYSTSLNNIGKNLNSAFDALKQIENALKRIEIEIQKSSNIY